MSEPFFGTVTQSVNGCACSISTYYITPCCQWTSAGLEPAGANNSPLKILKVYPNPTKDNIHLLFGAPLENSKLFIVSANGYIVKEYDVSYMKEYVCKTDYLSKGVYQFVLVSNGFYSEMISFVKDWLNWGVFQNKNFKNVKYLNSKMLSTNI